MKFRHLVGLLLVASPWLCCRSTKTPEIPTIGFIDAFEDQTIGQAKQGFMDALQRHGFSEDQKNVHIIYRNAQGSIPTLTQIVNYMIAQKVDLLATNTTISTITAALKTKTIPIFMMVAPTPELMQLRSSVGKDQENLFGTAENLDYIDSSFSLMQKLIKPKAKKLLVGIIYNPSAGPQSAAAMQLIERWASENNALIKAMPLSSTENAQLTIQSILRHPIDVFFASPNNVVFAAFETILKSCHQKNVPVFTSEIGLVKRGAVAAFGADIYAWGYQTGVQAAQFLKNRQTKGLKWQMVQVRKRVYNPLSASKHHIHIPANFEAMY